jgi:hypothetical protein
MVFCEMQNSTRFDLVNFFVITVPEAAEPVGYCENYYCNIERDQGYLLRYISLIVSPYSCSK